MRRYILFSILALLCASQNIFAQNLQTKNGFISAQVDKTTGLVTVLPIDAQNHGNIGFDQQLSFEHKSFFTCKIGNQLFTNNEIVALPTNGFRLTGGNTVKIIDANTISDTLRTTWSNVNGVDVIQDIYPIAFTKSGQIVYKWRFVNHNGSPIAVACQYLQDIQITDPHAPGGPSNDGPIILTRWAYKPYWEQYPNSVFPVLPWFYIGFLFNLPNTPEFNPGLAGMGYMDFGEPLNLIKPSRMTSGAWYDMAIWLFGSNPASPLSSSTSPIGSDGAVLVEFPPIAIPAGKTLEGGRTSYGTGEYEKCVGNLFSLVFYPHHIVWDPKQMTYSPNPIHIEKFVVDPSNINTIANTKITLAVNNNLTLVDSSCSKPIGKSQIQPADAQGLFIGPGSVEYLEWWICADPLLFCTGPITDTLLFTATCSTCNPGFVDKDGDAECELPIIVDCAETDIDAPQFVDTLLAPSLEGINVHDWRITDKGLQSITWTPAPGTDSTKFTIVPPSPPIAACYSDKLNHVIKIIQKDSTIGGCYDFTFTDCLGHQSFHTVCAKAVVEAVLDTIAPIVAATEQRTGVWSLNFSDNRLHDKGIDTIFTLVNSNFFPVSVFSGCVALDLIAVQVLDTTKDGLVCIRVIDCAKNSHDTCISFKGRLDTTHSSVENRRLNTLILEANHPNPFSHITTFTYTIAQYGPTKLTLYDELGKEMARIFEGVKTQGSYSVDFDGSKLPSGNYIVRLENGGGVISHRVVVER